MLVPGAQERLATKRATVLWRAHLGRMAHVLVADVALDPVDVGLLSTDGAVFALSCDSTGGGWRRELGRAVSWELLPSVSPARN